MGTPDSNSIASVGVCRVHPPPCDVVPSPIHCAMLFTVSAAVSVIHRLLGPANTNPYGAYSDARTSEPTAPAASGGDPPKLTSPAPSPDEPSGASVAPTSV